jgi:uncharacterized protein (DUF2336 family)
MTANAQPLITELVATLSAGSDEQNLAILQRVTDLFLDGWETFGEEHVAIFDNVIGVLIEKVPDAALAELSAKLAPIGKAPANVVACLACHDDIAVAGPVLEKSTVLTDETLAEIARTNSERHLAAIVARTQIGETVTDILVERSHSAVACNMTTNPGACFSDLGFVKLLNRAKTDKKLAAAIAGRTDVPSELEPFLKLALAS